MADLGAEFLFQVIAERAEKAAVILTTNLPGGSLTGLQMTSGFSQAWKSHARFSHRQPGGGYGVLRFPARSAGE